MTNNSFRRTIVVSFIGTLLSIFAVGGLSLYSLHNINSANDRETKKIAQELVDAKELQNLTDQTISSGRGYLIARDQKSQKAMIEDRELFWAQLAKNKQLHHSPEAQKTMYEVEEAAHVYQNTFDRIANSKAHKSASELALEFETEIRPRRDQLMSAIGKFEGQFMDYLSQTSEKNELLGNKIITFSSVAFLLAIILCSSVGWFLSKTLTRIYEQEAKARAAREDMLAIVSHDLRTPLTVFQLGCEQLQIFIERNASKDVTRSLIEKLKGNIQGMNRLIGDLLDFCRIEADSLVISSTQIDMQSIFESLKTLFEPIAHEKKIELEFQLSQRLQVTADRDKLHQALANLISNAIKFTPAGKKIQVKARKTENKIEINVRDEGQGIAQKDIPTLFDRYRQLKSTASHKGVGLGLYIVRGIILAHQGKIRVDSVLGQGTSFIIELPA